METLTHLPLHSTIPSLTVVALYFLVLFYLGFRGFKKTKTFGDYIIGGRKLGALVGALNVGASDMSSWLLMGLPGAFYLFGFNQVWMVLGLILGSFLSWSLLAVRLRLESEKFGNSLTISQFLSNRFNDKSGALGLTLSAIIIFFFTIYIASGFVGGAKLFSQFLQISYHKALLFSCVAIVLYALVGGFLAVSWADLFQGLLMLFVLLFAPIYILLNSDLEVFWQSLQAASTHHLDPFYQLNFWAILGSLSWGLGYFGQPHIISKYMAIKGPRQINLAKKICLSWMSLSMLGAASVGIIGFVYFLPQKLAEPETVFIALTSKIFHPIFLGLFIAAILAAIMSTINAQIIICASALTQDFYQKFFHKKASDSQMLNASRAFVLLVALAALAIAWDENSSVLALVARAWAGLGAGIGPVIIFALFSKKVTKNAAFCGVISGAISALIFSQFKFFSYEILPAFLLSSAVIFLVSFVDFLRRKNFRDF
jgi:sodium/proline symporter